MGTNTRLAVRISARRHAALRCWLLACCFVRVCTIVFESAHCQCLYRQAAPTFQSTAGVLKSSASACAVARRRHILAYEKLERDRDPENCGVFSSNFCKFCDIWLDFVVSRIAFGVASRLASCFALRFAIRFASGFTFRFPSRPAPRFATGFASRFAFRFRFSIRFSHRFSLRLSRRVLRFFSLRFSLRSTSCVALPASCFNSRAA